jgi:hypothetical protein
MKDKEAVLEAKRRLVWKQRERELSIRLCLATKMQDIHYLLIAYCK